MAELCGYMITWTTYGSWLQGDKRGYVKDGQILLGDKTIEQICQNFQKNPASTLNKSERDIVRNSILNEAQRIGHDIKAIAVCSNHVHLAAIPFNEAIEYIVSRYKNVATAALRKYGRQDKIWTRGFDKRFCFNQQDLQNKIRYIKKHLL